MIDCKKFTEFKIIKEKIIEILQKKFNELNTLINNKCFFVGFSIYRKRDNFFNLFYSLSIYTNLNHNISISENDFSGYVFNKISNKEGKKNHTYLKFFFNNLIDVNLYQNQYISLVTEFNDFLFQLYFVFNENISPVEREKIKEMSSFFKNKFIECIPKSDIKLSLKHNIRNLENRIIVIIDLIRARQRFNNIYKYLDVLLTSRIIFEIKKIAGDLNFKTINHTGDGFIFIYDSNENNINDDFYKLIYKINKFINEFKIFQKDLTDVGRNYKIRGIVKKCENLFEFDYMSSMDRKLFFSFDLDEAFEILVTYKNIEENLKDEYNLFFIIDKNLKIEQRYVFNENEKFYFIVRS